MTAYYFGPFFPKTARNVKLLDRGTNGNHDSTLTAAENYLSFINLFYNSEKFDSLGVSQNPQPPDKEFKFERLKKHKPIKTNSFPLDIFLKFKYILLYIF